MSQAGKNRGGQKAWTTNDQREWLTSKLADFQNARNNAKQGDFWTALFEEWFEKWPLGQPGDGLAQLADDMDAGIKRKVSQVSQTIQFSHSPTNGSN